MKQVLRLIGPIFMMLFFLLVAFYPISSKSGANDHNHNQVGGAIGQHEQVLLSKISEKKALEIARHYIEADQNEFGLTKAEIEALSVTDYYVSQHSGVTHIYFRQQVNGLDVVGSTINVNLTAQGEVFHVGNRLVTCKAKTGCALSDEVRRAGMPVNAKLSAIQAVELAAEALRLRPNEPFVVQERSHHATQALRLSDGGISQAPIPAKLLYQPLADGTRRLAWDIVIHEIGGQHWWNVRVDAETGALLAQDDWVIHDAWQVSAIWPSPPQPPSPNNRRGGRIRLDSPSPMVGRRASGWGVKRAGMPVRATGAHYRVLPWPYVSPGEPGASFELVASPADAIASPFGWHDTNGVAGAEFTDTQGNNVLAQSDKNGYDEGGIRPDGGQALHFDFEFEPAFGLVGGTNLEAGIVNLFYWNNLSHDIFYQYGFDEASGNFQQNNYGRGGIGGDAVYADAQDGGHKNNAYFGTPPEGQAANMQLYVWQHTIPNRASELENSVIVHEYAHGISTRLTGGANNVACLFHDEQMGEGWSDWLALVTTAKASDTRTQARSIAPYLLGQAPDGAGIRPAPYTTEMRVNGYTYHDIKGLATSHGVGFVWSSMLWEMYWNLVDTHGFNPNLYDSWQTGGNNLAIQLVLDGMKLQPCEPGFVDARDAILSADNVLTGGANQCLIWQAFAKRGLGASAQQGSPESISDGTQAFDLPQPCQFIDITPATQDICVLPKTMLNRTQGHNNSSDDFRRSVAKDKKMPRSSDFSRSFLPNLVKERLKLGLSTVEGPSLREEILSVTVEIGAGFTPPVALNPTTNAANATLSLNDSHIASVPFSTSVTLDSFKQVPAGAYTIMVTGTAAQQESATADFNLFTSTPDAPELITPSNQYTDTAYQPTFSWQATPQATRYVLELDDNPAFADIEHELSTENTSYTLPTKLNPLTTYYWRVRAINPCGESSYSAPSHFTTKARAAILLVDEDNNLPEAQPLYRAALNRLDKTYDVWDVSREGEPSEQALERYQMVMWFTGARQFLSAGPTSSSEETLSAYLDQGKCLLLSSQGYSGGGGTSFASRYLGVAGIERDRQQHVVSATEGLFASSEAYTLTYHFDNRGDILLPDSSAMVAFSGEQGPAALYKDGSYYRTAYFAFPLSALPEDVAREQIMQRFVEWCDDLHTGTLRGVVRDADSVQRIAGASVTAHNAQVQQTVNTSLSGSYRMVLPVGAYTMTVSESRYISDTINYIQIHTDTITTQDVTLQGSLLSYSPRVLETTVELGQVITKPLTLTNSGPLSTTFDIDFHFFNTNQAWVKAIPDSGELGPNSSLIIDLVLNPEQLPNLEHYRAWLRLNGSFVNQLSVLPIGMQLTCSTCGVLEGKMRDVQSGEPITPTIQVRGANDFQSTFTSDSYHLTLLPGPYTFIVSAEGYIPQQTVLTVTENITQTTDFALLPAFATLDVTPTLFSNTLAFNTQLTNSLFIRNLGTIDLDFQLTLSSFDAPHQDYPATWVNVLPNTGSVPPNSVLEVGLLFDATSPDLLLGSTTTNPVGSYSADLTLSGNFTSTTLPLTMQLTCPDCGLLSGSIHNAISGDKISATVQLFNSDGILFSQDEIITYTQLVLPNTYSMTIQAEGYFSQTNVITTKAGDRLNHEWHLMPIFAQLSYSEPSIQQLIERNQQLTKTVQLSNTGSIPLTYVIAEAGAPSSCSLPYLINSDFEQGTLNSWHVSGGWFINDGTYKKAADNSTTAPLADRFSAIADQRGTTFATLYQDIALPATVASQTSFSWIDQWENHTRWFDDDQEFRVELYGPGGKPLLGELFSTDGSYPNLSPATQRHVDVTDFITPYAGQSVRLQFVVESADYFLNVQVDSPQCEEDITWVHALPISGTIPPFSSTTIDLLFDSQAITETGTYEANLIFGSNSAKGNSAHVAPLLPLTMQVVEEVEQLYLPLVLR